jgi:pimeloyl-ACP methyl ester carboxylesterase
LPPVNKTDYYKIVDRIKKNPTPKKWLGGMTYLYHADAFQQKPPAYSRIKSPFLVIIGSQDPLFPSTEDFVKKGTKNKMNLTYLKIQGMDHYIRKHPDVIAQSFAWLKGIFDSPL